MYNNVLYKTQRNLQISYKLGVKSESTRNILNIQYRFDLAWKIPFGKALENMYISQRVKR